MALYFFDSSALVKRYTSHGQRLSFSERLKLYFPLSSSEEQATSGKPSGRVRLSCLPTT
jgi:hypothetical protein